jgi:hypothetical protein
VDYAKALQQLHHIEELWPPSVKPSVGGPRIPPSLASEIALVANPVTLLQVPKLQHPTLSSPNLSAEKTGCLIYFDGFPW